MSKTQSSMVDLGTEAPAFELTDVVSGRAMSRDDVVALAWDDDVSDQVNKMTGGGTSKQGRHGLLVMFICVHCPYVKHVEQELARIGTDYAGRIAIAAISSNDVESFPEDSPAEMKKQAACTPDFFLFDAELKLVYRGQLDDSRPQRPSGGGNDIPVTGKDLRAAMDAVIAGKRPETNQRSSIGCNIKWRES